MQLRQRALDALCRADPREKVALATALGAAARQSVVSHRAPAPTRQQLGESLRRQVEQAEEYAERHGLTLDHGSYRDL